MSLHSTRVSSHERSCVPLVHGSATRTLMGHTQIDIQSLANGISDGLSGCQDEDHVQRWTRHATNRRHVLKKPLQAELD